MLFWPPLAPLLFSDFGDLIEHRAWKFFKPLVAAFTFSSVTPYQSRKRNLSVEYCLSERNWLTQGLFEVLLLPPFILLFFSYNVMFLCYFHKMLIVMKMVVLAVTFFPETNDSITTNFWKIKAADNVDNKQHTTNVKFSLIVIIITMMLRMMIFNDCGHHHHCY